MFVLIIDCVFPREVNCLQKPISNGNQARQMAFTHTFRTSYYRVRSSRAQARRSVLVRGIGLRVPI